MYDGQLSRHRASEKTNICLDRTLKGIGILNAAPVYEELPGFQRYAVPIPKINLSYSHDNLSRPEGSLRCCCYSPEGRFFAWASPEQ